MLKKIVYRFLCNSLTGYLILLFFRNRIPNVRWHGYTFDITGTNISRTIAASIFFGFYEGAEIRFVEKHFKGDVDAVELGASSGIVSSHIVAKFRNPERKLVGVEANDRLSGIWKENVRRHNKNGVDATLLNSAVHYGSETVHFLISNNSTESRLSDARTRESLGVEVKATTLQEIVNAKRLGDYAMFCDIEGAEVEIFLHEGAVLQNCRYIFIELHDTVYKETAYSVKDLSTLIQKRGFELVDHHGPVHYYHKINI
jgi:FkbM family methyltransferase